MRDHAHIADEHRPGRARAAIGLLLLAGLLAIAVASTGAGAAPASPAGSTAHAGAAAAAITDPDTAEREFVAQINQLRASRGLGVLAVDGALTDQARAWATTMRDAGRIYHASDLSIGVDPNWLKLGENVGVGGDTGSLFQAFVNSPTHLENLVDGAYTHVGVGVVISADGSRMYTAHRFMALGAAPPPTTQPPRAPATSAPVAAPPPTAPATTAAPTTTVPVETTTTTAAPAPAPKLGPISQLSDLIDPD